MRLFLVPLLAFLLLPLQSQSQAAGDVPPRWWIDAHYWQGLPWRYYITESSGYMGPNALPVPQTAEGYIPKHPYIQVNGWAHLSLGDQTLNPKLLIGVPFGNRILIEASYVPLEYFQTDEYTRNIRYSLGYEGKGWTSGDLYFSTGIQFLKNKRFIPDIHGRAVLKTASGGKYNEARHTDAPGYYFDLMAGWRFNLWEKLEMRPFISGGFYSWQVNTPGYFQDDAILYSIGLSAEYRGNRIKSYLAGYSGYFDNGDRPVVFRVDLHHRFKKNSIVLQYQYGIRDFYFNSYSIGYRFELEKLNTNEW